MNNMMPPWVARKKGFQEGVTHAVETIFLDEAKYTRGFYQHRNSILIKNLNMIFDTCQKKDLPAEDYVKIKLEKMGYQVIDCRRIGQGHPDYIAMKEGRKLYVEVKSVGDGLRMEQARWIAKNPDKNVIIYWVQNVE